MNIGSTRDRGEDFESYRPDVEKNQPKLLKNLQVPTG